jgi:heme/copper-type cytochrome/quinol oxidase subunit 3
VVFAAERKGKMRRQGRRGATGHRVAGERSVMPQRGERDVDRSAASTVTRLGRAVPQSQFALRFFAVSVGLFGTAGLGAFALSRLVAPPRAPGQFVIPAAFAFSTTFLILCSVAQALGLAAVRRERQRQFRRDMLWALAFGTAFMGVQVFGMWCILQNLNLNQNAGEAQLGATALVMCAAAIHASHVVVALLILTYVTLRALADRYDHEYSFGVAACSLFWHILGGAWVFILGAYLICYGFLAIRVPPL